MSRRPSPLAAADPSLYATLARIEEPHAELIAGHSLLTAALIVAGAALFIPVPPLGLPPWGEIVALVTAFAIFGWLATIPYRRALKRRTARARELIPADPAARDRTIGRLCGDPHLEGTARRLAEEFRDEPLPAPTPVPEGPGSLRSRAPEWIGAALRLDRACSRWRDAGPAPIPALALLFAVWLPLREAENALHVVARALVCSFVAIAIAIALVERARWRRRRVDLYERLAAAGISPIALAAELDALGEAKTLARRLRRSA